MKERHWGCLSIFRRPPPIRDTEQLADFIDRNSAFLTQKGIYEYSRARAGHYAKVLFGDTGFQAAVEVSRWRAYPLGLAMVGELVEGVLRPYEGDRREQLEALRHLVLSVFDRYPVPTALGQQDWSEARASLARRLALVGLHPPKRAMDISGAVRGNLFQPDANPREAAPQRVPDHSQLPAGDDVQHP